MKSILSKKEKTAKKAKKRETFAQILKNEVISEIQSMPDKDFIEEVTFANSLNDEEALKEFRKEHKDDIQWILTHLNIGAITKRANEKINRSQKKE